MRALKKVLYMFRIMRKVFTRSPLYIALAFVTWFGMFAFLTNEVRVFVPVGGVFFAYYPMAGLMLLLQMFGLAVADQTRYSIDTYPGGKRARVLSGGILGGSCALFATVVVYVELMVLLLWQPPLAQSMLVYVLQYVLLSFFFPLLISVLLGMTIGLFVPHLFRYLLVLLVWVLTSPLAVGVVAYICSYVSVEYTRVLYPLAVLSLGRAPSFESPDIYGVSFQKAVWWLMIGKTLFVGTGCLSLLLCESRRRRRWIALSMALLLILAIVGTNNEQSLVLQYYSLYPTTEAYVYEAPTYALQHLSERTPEYSREENLTLLSCEITMRVGTGISVLCENTYTVEELCQEQSFTLYRLLHVTDVQVNGQKAAVEQKDNYLLVRFSFCPLKGRYGTDRFCL